MPKFPSRRAAPAREKVMHHEFRIERLRTIPATLRPIHRYHLVFLSPELATNIDYLRTGYALNLTGENIP